MMLLIINDQFIYCPRCFYISYNYHCNPFFHVLFLCFLYCCTLSEMTRRLKLINDYKWNVDYYKMIWITCYVNARSEINRAHIIARKKGHGLSIFINTRLKAECDFSYDEQRRRWCERGMFLHLWIMTEFWGVGIIYKRRVFPFQQSEMSQNQPRT